MQVHHLQGNYVIKIIKSYSTLGLQTQIASKQWPNHNSWSLVAQKFKVLFNNLSITYDEVKAMQLSLEEPTLMKEIENMIKENFLTVTTNYPNRFYICLFLNDLM